MSRHSKFRKVACLTAGLALTLGPILLFMVVVKDLLSTGIQAPSWEEFFAELLALATFGCWFVIAASCFIFQILSRKMQRERLLYVVAFMTLGAAAIGICTMVGALLVRALFS